MKKIFFLSMLIVVQQGFAATVIETINDSDKEVVLSSNVWWDKLPAASVESGDLDVETSKEKGPDGKEREVKTIIIPANDRVVMNAYIGWAEKSGSKIDESLFGKVGDNKFKIQEFSTWKEISGLGKTGVVTISTGAGAILGMGAGALAGAAVGGVLASQLKEVGVRFIRISQIFDDLGKEKETDKMGFRDKIFADNEDTFVLYINKNGLVNLINASQVKTKKAKAVAEEEEADIKKAKKEVEKASTKATKKVFDEEETQSKTKKIKASTNEE